MSGCNFSFLSAGPISFWLKTVTLTCPGEGTWYQDSKEMNEVGHASKYEFEYENKKKGLYRCNYNNGLTNYYFYVQGKGE